MTDQDFESIPRAIKTLLRHGIAMQLNLSELCDGVNPAQKLVTRDLKFEVEGSVDTMAQKLRTYINISLEEQFKWTSVEDALENWRNLVGDIGVFVFKAPFKVNSYSGFCLYDEEFPIIYINNSTTKTKQIFTLFHELAHLIFRTSGVDKLDDSYVNGLPDNAKKIETICNRFAGKFLVPDQVFNQELSRFSPNRDTAAVLANKFSVSREVIYRKCLDMALIDEQEYSRAASSWAKEASKGSSGGGNYYYNQKAYLGDHYIALAFRKYHQNRFDYNRLADYLNIKPKNVSSFEESLIRVGN